MEFVIPEQKNKNQRKIAMPVQTNQNTTIEQSYCNTLFVENKGSQIWKIKGFLTKCPVQNGKCLVSSSFNVRGFKSSFYIKLYPKGDHSDDAGVSLFLHAVEGEPVVTCEFALVDVSGRKQYKKVFVNDRILVTGWGFKTFIPRQELTKQKQVLLPNDELTVSCVVSICGEAAVSSHIVSTGRDACRNTVLDDWASLFERKEYTDVVLRVGGEVIPAHKTVLMCRSPVFAAMFKSDMRETNTNEVEVVDVERDVLVELLSFMYFDKFSVSEVGFTLKLLVAADKYAVSLLKRRCIDYLIENLSVANMFDILLVADACCSKELIQKCVHLIGCETFSMTDIVTKLDGSPNLIGVIKEHLNKK